MDSYQRPVLNNSQDMIQELFEEINEYLGDQGKSEQEPMTPSILSPFNLSTEGDDDDDQQIQEDETNTQDDLSNHSKISSPSTLQTAMFVESDKEDIYDDDDQNYTADPTQIEHHHDDQVVCLCYKCKTQQLNDSSQVDDNHYATTSIQNQLQPSISKQRLLQRPKSTTSFGVVSSAKLAHIAGLVKQTLTSTPRDLGPDAYNKRRHSTLDTNFSSIVKSSLSPVNTVYNKSTQRDQQSRPPLLSTHSSNNYTENISQSNNVERQENEVYNDTNDDDDHQQYTNTVNLAPTDWHTTNEFDSSSYDGNNQSLARNLQKVDPYPGEKEQISGIPNFSPLPFLTPIHRIGEPHSIVLRTKMAREVGTHEDRINAYNNAYSHCIMARTDMVPWIKKQYSKGPPDLVMNYTPKPKKSSKSLFGIFKRHSKTGDTTTSSNLLTSNANSKLSRLSVSSSKSSLSFQLMPSVSPQPTQTQSMPSLYQQEQQQQQQQQLMQNNQVESLYEQQDVSPDNATTCNLPSFNNRSQIDDHVIQQAQQEPCNNVGSLEKKKSKSFSSIGEPVSILKKHPSMTMDEPSYIPRSNLNNNSDDSGPHLKKKSSTTSFVDEPVTTLKKTSSIPSFNDIPYTSRPKTKSVSPRPSMEFQKSHHPSTSTSPVNNNGNGKKKYLLSPPTAMTTSRHQQQRSRSVSPSPRSPSPNRSRSVSPMAGKSSPLSGYVDSRPRQQQQHHHHHHRLQKRSSSDFHQRSPSPDRMIPSSSRYLISPEHHPTPRRHAHDTRPYRSSSNTSMRQSYLDASGPHPDDRYSDDSNSARMIKRTRSSEYLCPSSTHYPRGQHPPAVISTSADTLHHGKTNMKISGRHRSPSRQLSGIRSTSLEQQKSTRRHRRLSNASSHSTNNGTEYYELPPPLAANTGRRMTDPIYMMPPSAYPASISRNQRSGESRRRRKNSNNSHRRRTSYTEDELEYDDYYQDGTDGYTMSPNGINTRRWSSSCQQVPPPPQPLSRRRSKVSMNAFEQSLDDLCAFFHHLPRHVLATYLQDAQGDFFLAKDLCMDDIMANGI
ncbi:uncharacterized protein BX664DRAFT_338798 [Halteromyces radiatus]|uniref:uncharacterized protein n=1 Tax=Halteromyces radiatus TaxID=101107 RepID=UPI00221FD034|nr:uncharacterized protein BX664DRAFT_338798 [Halteromyces radiatus]KAI8085201.1 hypothetical protein BX664DRAFT_338798 [Halteromyces radiatus]